MAESDYRGQVPIVATIAPARAAYLFRSDDSESFRQAVAESSSRWAGQSELMIPVTEGGGISDEIRKLVTYARLDGAVSVGLSADDGGRAAAELALPLVSIETIDHSESTMWTSHPASFMQTVQSGSKSSAAPHDAPLWQITALGCLSEATMQCEIDHGLTRIAPSGDDVGRSQLAQTSVIHRSMNQISQRLIRGHYSSTPSIVWVTEENDLDACVKFWNLRALSPSGAAAMPMHLLPDSGIEDWLQFPQQFQSTLHRPDEFDPDVLLTGAGISDDDLHRIAALLELEHTDAPVRSGQAFGQVQFRDTPYLYSIQKVDYNRWVQFHREYGVSIPLDLHVQKNGAALRFNNPVPLNGSYASRTLVRLRSDAFLDLPKREQIASRVSLSATWNRDDIELRTLLLPRYDFQVAIPTLSECFDLLLRSCTEQWSLSDKGAIAAELDRNTDLNLILVRGVFEAMRELTTPRSRRMEGDLLALLGVDESNGDIQEFMRKWAGQVAHSRIYKNPMDLNGNHDRVRALEALCEAGWVDRGLETSCTKCHLSSFISFLEVGTRGPCTCPGCGSIERYTYRGYQNPMMYRLDSHIDIANDQGIPPHLITIAILRKENEGTLSHYVPGVDLKFADGTKREADILGLLRGRLILAEVKTSANQFTREQIQKDVDTCTRIGANSYIMAAMDSIPSDLRSIAEELCTGTGIISTAIDQEHRRKWETD